MHASAAFGKGAHVSSMLHWLAAVPAATADDRTRKNGLFRLCCGIGADISAVLGDARFSGTPKFMVSAAVFAKLGALMPELKGLMVAGGPKPALVASVPVSTFA